MSKFTSGMANMFTAIPKAMMNVSPLAQYTNDVFGGKKKSKPKSVAPRPAPDAAPRLPGATKQDWYSR